MLVVNPECRQGEFTFLICVDTTKCPNTKDMPHASA